MADLVVALDAASRDEAWRLARALAGVVRCLKVGLELFTAEGPEFVKDLRREGFEVFLDLKLHDIPNTVRGAVRSAVRLDVRLLTLHALGGREMMRAAAAEAAQESERIGVNAPALLGVTILTSQREGGIPGIHDVGAAVLDLARAARASGLAGVVASVEECGAIKNACGGDFLVATPGIRPAGSPADDQQRISTPGRAVAVGSDFLVVGRPVTQAADPRAAALAVLEEMR